MGLRKKDEANDDADSVVSSNGSVSAARNTSKRSRQSLNKSLSNENLKTSPVTRLFFCCCYYLWVKIWITPNIPFV